jgi:hypothetical protein
MHRLNLTCRRYTGPVQSGVQGATASLAFTATPAMQNL